MFSRTVIPASIKFSLLANFVAFIIFPLYPRIKIFIYFFWKYLVSLVRKVRRWLIPYQKNLWVQLHLHPPTSKLNSFSFSTISSIKRNTESQFSHVLSVSAKEKGTGFFFPSIYHCFLLKVIIWIPHYCNCIWDAKFLLNIITKAQHASYVKKINKERKIKKPDRAT